jgi:hypothetical protein
METLKDFLWPIVAIGLLGGVIDFLIGRAGQEKAKNFLFKWWVRFDDVRWRNFGREEGLFAGQLLDKWFGRKIWSSRRILSSFIILNILLGIGYIIKVQLTSVSSRVVITSDIQGVRPIDRIYHGLLTGWNWHSPGFNGKIIELVIWLSYVFFPFAIGISATRFFTIRLAYLCGDGEVRNCSMFLLIMIINYLVLILWFPLISTIKLYILSALISQNFSFWIFNWIFSQNFSHLISNIWQAISSFPSSLYPGGLRPPGSHLSADEFAEGALPMFPSIFRFLLTITFLGSVVLKPLVMRPVNLVWRRIVESDKPVFTLIFGGAAAFAKAVSEAAKHL